METPLAKDREPIDVAASRELRKSRQQSRFRARGGCVLLTLAHSHC